MNYYANTQLSQHGESPGATAQVSQNGFVIWEGQTVVGTFPDRDQFTSVITNHNGPVGSVKGLGRNNFHAFVCRQDNLRVLYSDGNKTCNSVYYCQDQ
jgi:hypothetical protein